MADLTVSVETHIDRSPDESFAWFADAKNLSRWFGGVDESGWVRKQEDGMPRPEDTFYTNREYRGRQHDAVHEVDVCDSRERVIEWHSIEGQMPIRVRIQCHESGAGTLSRMMLTAMSDSALTATMFVLMGWLSKPMMRRQYRDELEKARLILETRADAQLPTAMSNE